MNFYFKNKTKAINKTYYYNTLYNNEYHNFLLLLKEIKKEIRKENKIPVFLCIGSDRATGDCFGPLVGEALANHFNRIKSKNTCPYVFGTLEKPVHALNLSTIYTNIPKIITNPYIIAIDASLGIKEHIGYITFSLGSLSPGIGVQKKLPKIGDAAITGIVNMTGQNNHITLQTTHLSQVINMAEFVSNAISNIF